MSTNLSKMSEATDDVGRQEPTEDELRSISERLERASTLLGQLAVNGREGATPGAEALSAALTLVLGARARLYGDERPDLEGSGRHRIQLHFERNEGDIVSAAELAEVSGIRAWERRVRELRESGYDIEYLGGGNYRLNRGP